jgi:two-component sensor histidine kinase
MEVRITNEVRRFDGEKPESTGLGGRIVRRLMEEMDGRFSKEEQDGKYTAILQLAKA